MSRGRFFARRHSVRGRRGGPLLRRRLPASAMRTYHNNDAANSNYAAPCDCPPPSCDAFLHFITWECVEGQCVPGAEACNDPDPCTINTCDPVTGCDFPPVGEGASCGDCQECDVNGDCVNVADTTDPFGVCAPGFCCNGTCAECCDVDVNNCVQDPQCAICEGGVCGTPRLSLHALPVIATREFALGCTPAGLPCQPLGSGQCCSFSCSLGLCDA